MNKLHAALAPVLIISSLLATDGVSATLQCSTRQGSGVYAPFSLKNSLDVSNWWNAYDDGSMDIHLIMLDESGQKTWIPSSLWDVNPAYTILKLPSNGSSWQESPALEKRSTGYTMPARYENSNLSRQYPVVEFYGNLRVSTAVRSVVQLVLQWEKKSDSSKIYSIQDLTYSHLTETANAWPYEPTVDLGKDNPNGGKASYTFQANPDSSTSDLKLKFELNTGAIAATTFRVNGQEGRAGTPLEINGNVPAVLEVLSTNTPGEFTGRVTATLTCR